MMKMLKRLIDKKNFLIMASIVSGKEQAPSRNAISQIIALMIRKSDDLAPQAGQDNCSLPTVRGLRNTRKNMTEKASSFSSLPFAILMTAISAVDTPIMII